MFKKIVLIPIVLISLFIQAQTKIVVVPPSKDTTVVTFTANATATNTISSSITVKPTKVPPVNPPPDTVIVTPPSNGNYALIYSNGFDKPGDLDPFNHEQYGKGYIDLSSFLTGPGSFHSRPATVSGGERSEVSLDPETPLEGALEYDVRYNYVVQGECHSLQWHPSTGGGSASPGLWHVGGKFVIYNWVGGKNITHSTGYTIPTGKWIHIRIEYKFGSNGYFRIWAEGNLICSWTGQVGDNSTPYLKIGFNGNFDGNKAEADKSDIQYDNSKVYKLN